MSKEEKVQISITRTVHFKKSLIMQVVITAPLKVDNMAMVNNALENAVEIASQWKGSGSGE